MRRGSGRPGTTRRRRPRASGLRRCAAALVAALDDWAACAADRDQQAWVLAVVRQADPDPWRDRVRDPATWDDPAALRDLADRAPVAEQSPQLLAVLGARLRAKNLDAVRFPDARGVGLPRRLLGEHRDGQCALRSVQPAEAIGYYRTALALRPETVSLRYALGGLYLGQHRWDGAIAEYEQAIRLDPENAWCHNRLGFALAWKGGRDDEAIAQFREAIRLDANIGWSHYYLAIALERKGRLDEAADEFREAARLLPEKRAEWKRRPARAAAETGARRRGACRLEGGAGGSSAQARRLVRLRRAVPVPGGRSGVPPRPPRPAGAVRRGHGPGGRRADRTRLPAAAGAGGRITAGRRAHRARRGRRAPGHEFAYPYFLFAEGLARYRQGRFDDAIKLMTGEAASVMGPSPRLVLAMAQYQKGQKDQARKTLAAAILSYDWSAAKATTTTPGSLTSSAARPRR